MTASFKTIGLIGRVKTSAVKETLNNVVNYLLQLKQDIIIETDTAKSLTHTHLPIVTPDQLGQSCDLLIVVGGDGSLLHAAHHVIDHDTPVLGINQGSLGFLTDVLPSELHTIADILAGKFIAEERFLLTSTIEYHGKKMGQDNALNEAALIPDAVPHMIEFEIYINDIFVCSQDSDGLIIATPTGSTAYALSGGGPILHPQLDAIVLVPMFPHSLNNRPIVVQGQSEIRLTISPNNTRAPRFTCDGRDFIQAPAGSEIRIRKKDKPLRLIHPIDYDYYETLRSKLHWGKKLHYTE